MLVQERGQLRQAVSLCMTNDHFLDGLPTLYIKSPQRAVPIVPKYSTHILGLYERGGTLDPNGKTCSKPRADEIILKVVNIFVDFSRKYGKPTFFLGYDSNSSKVYSREIYVP